MVWLNSPEQRQRPDWVDRKLSAADTVVITREYNGIREKRRRLDQLSEARRRSAERRRRVADEELLDMQRRGLTREEMAEEAGVSPTAIGKRLRNLKP
jgi:hypothetical protein